MRFPISLRASLSFSLVGLAVVVALMAIGVHLTLAVRGVVTSSAERSRALAQQSVWLAGRALQSSTVPAETAIRRNRALRALFESTTAGAA